MGEVKVYGLWASPFSKRVEIALKLKGVEYEFIEEDLEKKSEELLKLNPVYKKIPVLVHNGEPICESLFILEYIDETWKDDHPLLPTDPYDRAQARFWAKFIDDKIVPAVGQVLLGQGEVNEKAIGELQEFLSILDNEIKENSRCNGRRNTDTVDYLDISGLLIIYWLPLLQEVTAQNVLTTDKFPGIFSWAHQLLNMPVIKENLPDKAKLVSMLKARFAPPSVV